ncbi:hypothetical protein PV706_35285, partial [Streptomyces europaeiscabiei]|uniref:hypothetical protein n=1 Tax=Streptomyces europaeiscabiei TaxID=146819 RepID=UPI0029AC1829
AALRRGRGRAEAALRRSRVLRGLRGRLPLSLGRGLRGRLTLVRSLALSLGRGLGGRLVRGRARGLVRRGRRLRHDVDTSKQISEDG